MEMSYTTLAVYSSICLTRLEEEAGYSAPPLRVGLNENRVTLG